MVNPIGIHRVLSPPLFLIFIFSYGITAGLLDPDDQQGLTT
jgi:hypothetical protein